MGASYNSTSTLSLPSHHLNNSFGRFVIWTAIMLALFLALAGLRFLYLFICDRVRRSQPSNTDVEKAMPISDTISSFSSIVKLYLWISSGEYRHYDNVKKQTPCLILTSPSLNLKDILFEDNFSTDGGIGPRLRSQDGLPGYLSPKRAQRLLEGNHGSDSSTTEDPSFPSLTHDPNTLLITSENLQELNSENVSQR